MSATSRRGSRPQSSYGRRNSVERMPRRVQTIVDKNVATEFQINRTKLRRIQSDAGKKHSRHHGDENLEQDDLTTSMPERMMRLTVGERRSRSRSDSTSPLRKSFDADLRTNGDASPKLINKGKHSFDQGSPPKQRRASRAEISNAKLAMMKKRLEPLPNRNRVPSNEDLRDYSP